LTPGSHGLPALDPWLHAPGFRTGLHNRKTI